MELFNEACSALGLSPVEVESFPLKMRGCAVRNKSAQICTSISDKLHASFEIVEEPFNSSEMLKQADEYQTLISSLQTKMRRGSSFKEKCDN